jgi:hypothetical protein
MTLIAAAGGADTEDDSNLFSLTPGERDARLYSVRRDTFGPTLDCVVACPACGESLEFTADIAALVPEHGTAYAADTSPATLADDGYQVTVRPPTLGDVEELASLGGQALIDRCVLHADHNGEAILPAEFPPHLVTAIDERLSAADPAAVTEMTIVCPACSLSWTQVFDITGFLWAEVSARAERVLLEVHVLAREYGWSESEILALSTAKREKYLELVRG